jgi:hypothetical protein
MLAERIQSCGGEVIDYRLYFLNDQGRIVRAEPFACADDSEALKRASSLSRGEPAELWRSDRIIGRLGPVAAVRK